MTASQTQIWPRLPDDQFHFNAILHPYRSLGKQGFRWLMIVIGLIILMISLIFFALGAWPIVGFAGLDLLLIYWAFRTNYREAQATEEILVSDRQLLLIRTTPDGKRVEEAFNPYWVRLETGWEDERGMTHLGLTSHGRRVEIGAFLHACERESLAKALTAALQQAKSPRHHAIRHHANRCHANGQDAG